MGYLGNVKKQFWITFTRALIPAYVIERLFWQQRGISVQMVVYAEILYALTVVLLEIPSGILSDKLGRKRMLSLYNTFSVIEMTILLFAHHFWQFALAVFFAGIGKALASGSENALLYDSLFTEGKQKDFEKLIGRVFAINFAGAVVAALSGSMLANFFSFELNYILSIISISCAFILTLTLKEPPIMKKQENEILTIGQYIQQSIRVFKSQPLVFVHCLTGATIGGCLIYLDEFWQILMESIGMPLLFFGIISALALSIRIPGNLLAYKLKARFDTTTILIGAIFLNAAGYLAVFFMRSAWCLIPMALVFAMAGIIDPLVSGFLHHHTESNIRATVESLSSLGLRLLSMLIGLAFGYVSTYLSIFAGFALLGCICIGYLLFFCIWHPRASTK